jgi:hypothetical protein
MSDRSVAAMKEGVQHSTHFVSVVSGSCINNDRPQDPPEGNASFRREFVVKEIRWRMECGKPIQPIIRMEDKSRIGEFLSLLDKPLKVDGKMQDISDLKRLGDVDWIDLNRNDNEYWKVGMKKVLRALQKASLQVKKSSSNETKTSSSSVTGMTSSIDQATMKKALQKQKERMEKKFELEKKKIEKKAKEELLKEQKKNKMLMANSSSTIVVSAPLLCSMLA